MWPNLGIWSHFTEEVLNEKLHFLCSDLNIRFLWLYIISKLILECLRKNNDLFFELIYYSLKKTFNFHVFYVHHHDKILDLK